MNFIFDIRQLACETVGILNMYTPNLGTDKPQIDDMEYLIWCILNSQIERKLNKLVFKKTSSAVHYRNYIERYRLYLNPTKKIVESMTGFIAYSQIIEEYIKQDTFEYWIITKGMGENKEIYQLESAGDYRILEWEADHLINGIYVSRRRTIP